jgi:hypothetical protein
MATQKRAARRLGSAAGVTVTVAAAYLLSVQRRRRRAQSERHRLHFDLLCKAMDDPALTAVLDTYETDVPADKQRQFLFANALYINALHAHQIGAISLKELFGHLRVMCQNRVFREYWEATRHHRASLEPSLEARLGRMVDQLIHDLEEADTEEWWVVGEPPSE